MATIINWRRIDVRWIFLSALPVLVWALALYPSVLRKNDSETYFLHFSLLAFFQFYLVFFVLYLLPGLVIFFQKGKGLAYNPIFSPQRFLLAFLFGMAAHTIAILLQKYLQLPYRPWWVLGCLALAYGLLYFTFPSGRLLAEDRPDYRYDWLVWPVLLLALGLGMEMVLRARASSVSLMGDGYPHFIGILATLEDGPLPDALPFYSTFILNIHPMSYHALMANLLTLIPGAEPIDPLRYFSAVMVPYFIVFFFAFFTFLAKNRAVGALATLALLWVSGGGLTLRIPIFYYPWYWSLAWLLSAGVFYLLLKDNLESPSIAFWAGVLLGVGVLMHPMVAFRMGAILFFFLPLEILRRFFCRQPILPLWIQGGYFLLGALLLGGLWLGPLLLRFGWEETYSYEYIVENFGKLAPQGVDYLKSLREQSYRFRDVYFWTIQNAGLFPMILFPVGLAAIVRKWREPMAALLFAWLLAMGVAVLFPYLPNPYRYFEYLFLGMFALAAFGLGWLLQAFPWRWQPLILLPVLLLTLVGVRREFFPKYRLALQYYGRSEWPANTLVSSQTLAQRYLASKRNRTLDRDFGAFRGYLWSRQKKIWDIYLKTRGHFPETQDPAPGPGR